jgi:hypothetical protein
MVSLGWGDERVEIEVAGVEPNHSHPIYRAIGVLLRNVMVSDRLHLTCFFLVKEFTERMLHQRASWCNILSVN